MVNNVVLVGRITRDIELKATSANNEVVNFTLAVSRNYKNNQGEYDADFINCVAFGPQARFMNSYLAKGRLIAVEGEIRTRSYDNQQGQRVYVTEVLARQVSPLESRSNSQGMDNYQNTFQQASQQSQIPMQQGQQPQINEAPMQTTNEPSPYDFMNFDEIDDNDLPF